MSHHRNCNLVIFRFIMVFKNLAPTPNGSQSFEFPTDDFQMSSIIANNISVRTTKIFILEYSFFPDVGLSKGFLLSSLQTRGCVSPGRVPPDPARRFPHPPTNPHLLAYSYPRHPPTPPYHPHVLAYTFLPSHPPGKREKNKPRSLRCLRNGLGCSLN